MKNLRLLVLLAALLMLGAALPASAQPQRDDKGPVSHDLLALHEAHTGTTQGFALRPTDLLTNPLLRVHDGKVVIDAVAAESADALRGDLEALGLEEGATYGAYVSGWLPISSIDELADLKSLHFVRPAYATTQVGLVTSQGVAAMRAEEARAAFGVDGSGITVGSLSDSFNCLGGADEDVRTGDLPEGIVVLEEGPCPATDEGRAMMQLIRDVAPGASQAFHTAFNGQADFAQGILELASEAGADVIVDDVFYTTEPFFQDGIIAQAVDEVKAMGVSFFSSAGNNNREAYASTFRAGPSFEVDAFEPLTDFAPFFFGGTAHDFDPGPGVDVFQQVTMLPGSELIVSFQWAEPYASVSGAPGSASDLDIYILNEDATGIYAGGVLANVGGDPIEFTGLGWGGTEPLVVNIMVTTFEGRPPGLMKMIRFGGGVTIDEYDTRSGTIFGHSNAAGALAVGAVFYGQTPAFGTTPPVLEPFSAAGPTPILFDPAGNRLPEPEIRRKPDVAAPDGTNTTFFGVDIDIDDDAFPNFFGTSAAAPHAAGVAALMVEAAGSAGGAAPALTLASTTAPSASAASSTLAPGAVYAALENTAIDMDDPFTPGFDTGFDFGTGHGLIQADRAVAAVTEPVPVDDTPPVCGPIEVIENSDGQLTAVETFTADAESGIASITFTRLDNMQGFLDSSGPFQEDDTEAFDPGATERVDIRGERIDFSAGGIVLTRVTNGAGLSAQCDPVVDQLMASVPEHFSLKTNYPNPFSTSTTIEFGITEAMPVTITVYDLLGRKVTTLVDEEMAPSTYTVEWDGRDAEGRRLSSGTYVYRIEAGSYITSRKMILLR